MRRLLLALAFAGAMIPFDEATAARPRVLPGGPACDNDGRCVVRDAVPGRYEAPPQQARRSQARWRARAATPVAHRGRITSVAPVSARMATAETRVLGGRPAACWRPKARFRWCGCAAAIEVGLPNPTGHWDYSGNWFGLPRAAPGYNMAAVRYGHIAILKRHLGGTMWMAYDPNSGQQLARLHPIDLRRYRAVVNPGGAARAASTAKPAPTAQPVAATQPATPLHQTANLPAIVVAEMLDDAREFLIRTAVAGSTMLRLGRDEAIGRLHPTFAVRLAGALAEARRVPGLQGAACFSAYRPPAFGVGGYRDKFQSNHAYGLACDLAGIGRPGSREHVAWHEIAARHRLYNPYYDGGKFVLMCGRRGCRPATHEWNHYQPTPTVTAVRALPALRRTITKHGPIDARSMWRVADALIDRRMGGVPAISARKRTRVARL